MGYSYTIIFKNTPLPAILKKRLLKFCVVNVIPLTNIFAEIMNSYAVGSPTRAARFQFMMIL